MSRHCPFCGIDHSQTEDLFCHRCHNKIREDLSGDVYNFPPSGVLPAFDALVKVYASIFQSGSTRFSEANLIIRNQLNRGDNFGTLPSGLIKVADDALFWAKKLCKWEVYFDDNGAPQNLAVAARPDIYKDIEDTANLSDFGRGINEAIEKIRIAIGKEEYAVRAKNLCRGCSININGETKIDQDSIDSIKGHAKLLERDEPMIFISAPSYDRDTGNRVLEYAVGRALKYQLDTKGVSAFWWENFNKDINILGRTTDKKIGSLRIAAKIAFGLAFSSIFIGLAFGDAQNFSQNRNCKYEIEKFHDFKFYAAKAKEYVSFDEVQDDIKDASKITNLLIGKLPKKRVFRLLTEKKGYEEFEDSGFIKPIMDTLDGDEEININCSGCKTVDAYVGKALEAIFDILQHNYKNKYKSLKAKNGFDSDDEFKAWFCKRTGDIGAFHEIINAPTNYNCSYAVLDEFGVDVHDQLEFFVERTNYLDTSAKRAKRAIRLNMVVNATNDLYISDKKLARKANEKNPTIADGCGFLFNDDTTQYQKCEINFEDTQQLRAVPAFRFSDYTRNGGTWCVVEDIDSLNSGIFGTIKFESDNGDSKVFHFAITLTRQSVKMPKKVEHVHGRLYDSVKRKVHCPYCAEPLPYFTHRVKKSVVEQGIQCNGSKCDTTRFGNRRGMILCDQQNPKSPHAFVLPDNYEKSKSAFITMMGLSDVGKSVFISKLFGVEKGKIDFSSEDAIVIDSVKLSDEYIKYALSPYVSSVSCYRPEAVASAKDNPDFSLWEDRFLKSDPSDSSLGIFTHYCSIPYANFVEKTFIKVGETLHYAPLILKLETHDGLENYFSFYDLPGEEIAKVATAVKTQIGELKQQAAVDAKIQGTEIAAKNALKHITLLQNSNGIILMINAGSKADEKSKGIKDICDILTKFLSRKKYDAETDQTKDKQRYKQVKNVAIAVVLCQFDRIEHEFEFDNIVRTLAPLEDADFYRRSEMEKYIDACSMELKKYLSLNGYDQLIDIIDNFVFHKYFAVSAIGHQDSIKENRKTAGRGDNSTRFISNPRGIDNVLVWLAYQMGMID